MINTNIRYVGLCAKLCWVNLKDAMYLDILVRKVVRYLMHKLI